MERNRKDREGGVLGSLAELFDLPADIVAGLPRLGPPGPGRPPDPPGHDGGRTAHRGADRRRGMGGSGEWLV